jgi:hypothetical protein
MERPAFVSIADGPEFYVLITWPSGSEARIRDFGALQDAQRWIDHEAENWLQIRALGPSGARSNEDDDSNVSSPAGDQLRPASVISPSRSPSA